MLTKKDLLEAIEDMPMDAKIRIWDDGEGQWGIMRQRLLEYLSNRVQNDDHLQDLLIWSCERFGDTRHDYHCEQCGDDVYTTTLEI